jgi:hypothetical protein
MDSHCKDQCPKEERSGFWFEEIKFEVFAFMPKPDEGTGKICVSHTALLGRREVVKFMLFNTVTQQECDTYLDGCSPGHGPPCIPW